MGYHSADGRHFLGWRRNARGQIEVIHDLDGRRRVFELAMPPQLRCDILSEALAEAVQNRNVIAALHRQFSAHRIVVTREAVLA